LYEFTDFLYAPDTLYTLAISIYISSTKLYREYSEPGKGIRFYFEPQKVFDIVGNPFWDNNSGP